MTEMAGSRLESRGSPTGWLRALLRGPIALYRARLGFVFGNRFLMLEHRGRRSGKTRRTVLEVVASRPGAVYVAAAWGARAQWLRNVEADPEVVVHLGARRFDSTGRVVDEMRARSVLAEYAAKHPVAFDRLAGLMLEETGTDTESNVRSTAAVVPIVELSRGR